MAIVKSYFTKGSRVQIAYWRFAKFELSATKVNGFQCKAVSTQSSTLDIVDVPDQPQITIFGKATFYLTQLSSYSI